jgi:aminopeptidase
VINKLILSTLSAVPHQSDQVRDYVGAETNTRRLSNTDPSRPQRRALARRDIMETHMQRAASKDLRWVGTIFPTEAYAQDADMRLEDYENFVYGAGLLDDPDPVARWREFGEMQQQKVEWLKGHKWVHIRGRTPISIVDCRSHLQQRLWQRQFSDGEIFTGPVKIRRKAGYVSPIRSSCWTAKWRDVEFTFEKGEVVKATARKNEDALNALLETDAGARFLGEAGIGTSPNITRFTRSMLFD